jgi:hemolysin D
MVTSRKQPKTADPTDRQRLNPVDPASRRPEPRSEPRPIAPQWSNSLQGLLDQPSPALPARMILACMAFTGLFGIWAWTGTIDEIATARGKMIPLTEARKVQAAEAGKVARVMVKEGDVVQAGQVLFELDNELNQQDVQHQQTLLESARQEYTQTGGMLYGLQAQVESRIAIARAEASSQDVAIRQAEATVENQRQVMSQMETDEAAQQERIDRIAPLVKEGALSEESLFGPKQALRERQRGLTESQGLIDRTLEDVNRLRVGLQQKMAEARQSQLAAQHQIEQMRVRMTELQSKINENTVLISAAKTKAKQRYVNAPSSGKITLLNVKQPGEVIQLGQAIGEIAPEGKPLVLTTVLPSQDAGFVKTGMAVKVKLDAFPYQDYGVVEGKVTAVSLDSKLVEGVGQVYKVDIELSKNAIQAKGESVPLKSGQTATGEIVTRHRRIIDVLLDPLKKMQGSINI